MKPSGSLNDIAGSVKVYLHKKQQQKSLVEEVLEVHLHFLSALVTLCALTQLARAVRPVASFCIWSA